MKRLIVLFIFLFSSLCANPISLEPGFSEIQILDDEHWFIEFYNWDGWMTEYDSFIIANSTDTVGIQNIDSIEALVIDQNDVSDSFSLNINNDFLKLYIADFVWWDGSISNYCVDQVYFGEHEASYIHNLDSTQSIARHPYHYVYYKKSEPTLGIFDSTDNRSTLYGHFYDINGDPIRNIYFLLVTVFDRELSPWISINSDGSYSAKIYPRYYSFDSFHMSDKDQFYEMWDYQFVEFDIEPNDSLEIDFHAMQTSIIPVIKNNTIKFNNYPHPASNYTWFFIDNTDVEASAMRVNVYALNGRKVDSFIPAAKQFRYDCSRLPQGSYILSLQKGSEVLASKKLQIVK